MAYDQVAARYAQALFETVKSDGQLDHTFEQLAAIGKLLHESAGLRQLLLNPDVEPLDKVGVLDRVLGEVWSAPVRAFVTMVMSKGRSDALAGMVEAFRDLVDQETRQLRVVVRSAAPLSDATLHRLRTILEHREHQSIHLQTEVAPELIGGLQLVLGHRLIDGSVKRQLTELREQLTTTKVA